MRIHGLVIVTLLTLSAANAGVLKLKDGSRVEGELRKTASGWEVVTATGTRTVDESQVVSIESGSGPAAKPEDAPGRVASLKRAVEAMDNIDEIIKRYEVLYSQVDGTPAAADVKAEIAKWRDLKTKNAIKLGSQWLEPAAVKAIDEKNTQLMRQAIASLDQNNPTEAAAFIKQVLDADPGHLGALYLDGLVSYQQQRLPQARRDFEQVVAALPSHWPSVHNLAVLQWRQRAQAAALENFSRAMAGMPLVPLIHDNVLEVANAMTPEMRQSQAGSQLLSRLKTDELRLQGEMEKEDRYRWGSQWVTGSQLEKLKQEQAKMEAQLAQLSKDYAVIDQAVSDIDDQIARNENDINAVESRVWTRDDNGQVVVGERPTVWYDLQREHDRLKDRRQRLVRDRDSVRRQADQLRASAPTPPYSGRLELLSQANAPVFSRIKSTR